jgi:hypothetical protein
MPTVMLAIATVATLILVGADFVTTLLVGTSVTKRNNENTIAKPVLVGKQETVMTTNKILPFHEWKQRIVDEDSKKHGVTLYFRWTRQEFYTKYGHYVQKMRRTLSP